MADMLTSKDMQTLLQVDRSTIYRMAEAGRLPAIKVGKQWRFPGDLVQSWFKTQATSPMPLARAGDDIPPNDFAGLLPLDCVQLILDTYADALGVMLVVTDIRGNPVTQVSHPCGLFSAISAIPNALQKCIQGWQALGAAIDLEPKFSPGHLGLLCARGMIRVGTELKGMVIAGGIAPDDWPPNTAEVKAIAAEFGVNSDLLTSHLNEVFELDEVERARILSFTQRIANVMAHIANERNTLMSKLESIAKLAR